MYVRINLVEEERAEYVGTRSGVALQLVSRTLGVKVGQHEESYGGESVVVGIDVH